MNILLIYPEFPDTFWSFKHALSFVHKKASSPPLGLLTIASLLPKEWAKHFIDMNVRSLSEKDIAWSDMIFLSAMAVQRQSVREVIRRCRMAGKIIVAGGPLFTGEWQDFPEVDHFILNEGEITLPLFLSDFSRGTPQHVYTTHEFADIEKTPVPMWELVDFSQYDSLTIQYSRGCPFNCDFCNITALLGHHPRTKSSQQIVAELDLMYSLGWRRNVFFVDDNFICNKRQLKSEILPALIDWRQEKKGYQFITEASINLADDVDLMKMMTSAGFISVFVGIETPDENSLIECKKNQNIHRDLIETVHRLQQHGLEVMGGFIVGFDNDSVSIFQRQIEFIQKSGIVTAMVGILQAPYGTRLYERMKKEGRLIAELSGDNGDGSTNIVPAMGMEILRDGYQKIIHEIYAPTLFYERIRTFLRIYNPQNHTFQIQVPEFRAFFESIWKLGILDSERFEYWRLFFWTLLKYPKKFQIAITLSIYGYHFRQVSVLNDASIQ